MKGSPYSSPRSSLSSGGLSLNGKYKIGLILILVVFIFGNYFYGGVRSSNNSRELNSDDTTLSIENNKRYEIQQEQLKSALEKVEILEQKIIDISSNGNDNQVLVESDLPPEEEAPSYPNYQTEDEADTEDPIVNEMVEPHVNFHDKMKPDQLCPNGVPRKELFSDGDIWAKSGYWPTYDEELKSYAPYHWATQVYEKAYKKNPPHLHIPHLNVTISQEAFVACFMNTGFPVIINMERLKPLGYTPRVYPSIADMLVDYPVKHKVVKYKANALFKGTPDLGPALVALQQDAKKKIMGAYRNYPRNMKLSRKALFELGLSFPPYHNPRDKWQLSTIFMGATTADTPSHSDCCDNFVAHMVGTKRWVLSAPTEARNIKPRCFGGLCWSKTALPMHATAPSDPSDMTKYESVDIKAGEMLYLPAAWSHAVYNLVPTVTLINWVASGPSQLYVNQTGLTGGQTSRRNYPCLPNYTKC